MYDCRILLMSSDQSNKSICKKKFKKKAVVPLVSYGEGKSDTQLAKKTYLKELK